MINKLKLAWLAIVNYKEMKFKLDIANHALLAAKRDYKEGECKDIGVTMHISWREVAARKGAIK